MSKEQFRTITKAPLYEIDKTGFIRKVGKETPILPFPLGSNTVKLTIDEKGRRETFVIDDLIADIWDGKREALGFIETPQDDITPKEEEKVAQIASNTEIKQEKTPSPKAIEKIMKTKCKMSFKIWKLYDIGLSIQQIKDEVKHPHSVGVYATIERYKKSETLRDRANKAIK